MNLQEFVSESIVQICKGIAEAQEKTKNMHVVVNVPTELSKSDGKLVIANRENNRTPQLVDFDICVAVEKTEAEDIKGKIKIFPLSFSGKDSNEKSDSETSRIKFSVPILFPTDAAYYYDELNYKENASKGMKFNYSK